MEGQLATAPRDTSAHELSSASGESPPYVSERNIETERLQVAIVNEESKDKKRPSAAHCAGSRSDGSDSQPIPGIPGLRPAQWLLDQDPESYVIQVLSVSSLEGLQRFAKEHKSHFKMAYFRICQHAKERYVVVVGPFASFTAAKDANRALPASVRNNGPWIRKLSQVHRRMASTSTGIEVQG